MFKFDWWKTEDNREGAKAITDVLKVVVPAIAIGAVAIFTWLGLAEDDKTETDPKPVIINSDGGAVNTGSGTQIIQAPHSTIINGYSIEKHEAILEKRMTDLRSDLERATNAEKRLLQQELTAVSAQLGDIETSFETAKEELHGLRLRLKEFSKQVSLDSLERAQTALYEGDRSLADKLFAEIETKLQDEVKLAAQAAFARGEIAEGEIRWHDAAEHYGRAARLDPSFKTLRKASDYTERSGDYPLALQYSTKLLRLARGRKNQAQLSSALNEHALNSKKLGHFAEAETLYREALAIDEKTIGTSHPGYAIHLNNLAGVVEAQGRYGEAETLYREALAIDEKTIGKAHPSYAIRLNNLAGVVKAQGRSVEAEALYREALTIDEKTIGKAHPSYAIRLNNLAGVVKAQGRYAEAETLYREALAIGEKTIGTAHPDYATHLNNLALVVKAQGRYDEAETLYREALAIREKTIGTAHPDYAIHLNNLAGVVQAQGRYDEAETLYRKALAIDEKTIGTAHPDYAIHLGNLARVLSQKGDQEAARAYLDEAMVIFQNALPEDHPYIIEIQRRIDALPSE